MDPLPPLLRLTLRPGTVYYFTHRDLTSSEPHYFVVLNGHPQSDAVLLLAVASSQLGKVRRRRTAMPPETLVEVTPAEYADFTVPTIVDCNQVFELPREELIEKITTKQIRGQNDLPAAILAKICVGVLLSPRVDEAYKKRLAVPMPIVSPGGRQNS